MEAQSRSRESSQAPLRAGVEGPRARAREVVGSTGVRSRKRIPPETLVLLSPGCNTSLFPSACSPDPGILSFLDIASRGRKSQTAASRRCSDLQRLSSRWELLSPKNLVGFLRGGVKERGRILRDRKSLVLWNFIL